MIVPFLHNQRTKKKLLILYAPSVQKFSEQIAHAFDLAGGEAEIVDINELSPYHIPGHDLIHARFAVPRSVSYYSELKGHQREHGCHILPSLEGLANTVDKLQATNIASQVMTVPMTKKFRGTYDHFPCVVKPRFSSGGTGISFLYSSEDLANIEDSDRELIVQDAVDFTKLLRVVYMNGEIIDAVYDIPTSQFQVQDKLGKKSKVLHERRDELARICKKLSRVFLLDPLVVDLFEDREGEYVFNEANAATNLFWLRYRSGVPHATKLARYLMNYV